MLKKLWNIITGKRAMWVGVDNVWECSECGKRVVTPLDRCSECGRKMMGTVRYGEYYIATTSRPVLVGRARND